MTIDGDEPTETGLPTLLRAGRRTYGTAMRAALDEAGYGDIPANGLFVLGAVSERGGPPSPTVIPGARLSSVIAALGVSKQAAGALVDSLVARGYLERSPDPADRRRLIVACTERGDAAAEIIRAVAARIDAALRARVGDDQLRSTQATLAVLAELGEADA